MNSNLTPEKLVEHSYHDIVIVNYGEQNVSLECNTCCELLADCDTDLQQSKKASEARL